jgi:IS5 family transposase
MLDVTHVKGHRSTSGGKGRGWSQAIGRSRGGFTSKTHCLADGRGRPVAFALTLGNVADITVALPLLQAVVPPKRLIADKAYDAQRLRDELKKHRVIATILSPATRMVHYKHSRIASRRRKRIERLFGHLRNWWRVATRYDRLHCNYLAAVALP